MPFKSQLHRVAMKKAISIPARPSTFSRGVTKSNLEPSHRHLSSTGGLIHRRLKQCSEACFSSQDSMPDCWRRSCPQFLYTNFCGEFLVEIESQLNKSEFSVNLKILSYAMPISVYFCQTVSASTALSNTHKSYWNAEGNPPSSKSSVAIPRVTGLVCHTGYKIHLQKSI